MGSKILYYLIIKPISKLPYFILYGISDFFYFIIFHVVGYRKKVVFQNLKNSFPEKSKEERTKIARKFYHHFADLIIESLKNFSITEENAKKRMLSVNEVVLEKFHQEGRSVVLCGGHYGNWELWAMAAAGQNTMPIFAIYKKLSNDFFNIKMKESRSRYGLNLVPTKSVASLLEQKKNDSFATVYGFDQSPGNPKKAYWTEFLNQDTPCAYGPEKFATKYNSAVVYVGIEKLKRGHYQATYETLIENPQETEYGEIITTINQRLEQDIIRTPYLWLWTHKRWKHKRNKSSE